MTPNNPENPPAVPSPDQGPEHNPDGRCLTCDGHGMIGGWEGTGNDMSPVGYPCPDCAKSTEQTPEQRIAKLERENEQLKATMSVGWGQLLQSRDENKELRATIETLTRERDEARAERDSVSRQISQIGELLKGEELTKEQVNETGLGEWVLIEQRHAVAKLRAQLAASEKDRKALEEAAQGLADRLREMDAMFSAVSKCIQWGKTFLNVDAIRQMNEAPLNAAAELARFDALKGGEVSQAYCTSCLIAEWKDA